MGGEWAWQLLSKAICRLCVCVCARARVCVDDDFSFEMTFDLNIYHDALS